MRQNNFQMICICVKICFDPKPQTKYTSVFASRMTFSGQDDVKSFE